VVVLTLEKEADESISWSEYSRRVGCGPTVLSWMYDQVLDEALLVSDPHGGGKRRNVSGSRQQQPAQGLQAELWMGASWSRAPWSKQAYILLSLTFFASHAGPRVPH
jgi:hypothetical protein